MCVAPPTPIKGRHGNNNQCLPFILPFSKNEVNKVYVHLKNPVSRTQGLIILPFQ